METTDQINTETVHAKNEVEYLLVEGESLHSLQDPLKRATRLKYNCISVSDKLIALGSNTGGIYIFSRSNQKLLQIAFAEQETNAVSLVKISPHERYLAFVSIGNVHVLDLRLDSRSRVETLKSADLSGALVTCLIWDESSSRLYFGDDMGNVLTMPVYTNRAKNLFSLPPETILKLDSMIVQLDKSEDKVLVSTITRCYLCDTVRKQFSQIGVKLRDGHFGACFLSAGNSSNMIYCARPGSRIWEVDFDGNVINTHQFRQLLAIPPHPVFRLTESYGIWNNKEDYLGQSVSFPKLQVFSDNFVITWTKTAIYVLDPVNVKVILWCNALSGITDVCCVRNEMYIFLQNMEVQKISMLHLSKVMSLCIASRNLEAAAMMCIQHGDIFMHKHVRKKFGTSDLKNIYDKLTEANMNELAEQVKHVWNAVQNQILDEQDRESCDSLRSRSGSSVSAASANECHKEEGISSESTNEGHKGEGISSASANECHKGEWINTASTNEGHKEESISSESTNEGHKGGGISTATTNVGHKEEGIRSACGNECLKEEGRSTESANEGYREEHTTKGKEIKELIDDQSNINNVNETQENELSFVSLSNSLDKEQHINVECTEQKSEIIAELDENQCKTVVEDLVVSENLVDYIMNVNHINKVDPDLNKILEVNFNDAVTDECCDLNGSFDSSTCSNVLESKLLEIDNELEHNIENSIKVSSYACNESNSQAINMFDNNCKVYENKEIIIDSEDKAMIAEVKQPNDMVKEDSINQEPGQSDINIINKSTLLNGTAAVNVENISKFSDQSTVSDLVGPMSPNTCVTVDNRHSHVIFEDDDIEINYMMEVEPRRSSITSLSSMSSAEVHFDQGQITDSSAQLAIPVTRRKEHGRKSSNEHQTRKMTRSQSLITIKLIGEKKSADLIAKCNSFDGEDSISLYSNDSIGLEDPNSVLSSHAIHMSEEGSPLSTSTEFALSGEYERSDEYPVKEESSSGIGGHLQSGIGSQAQCGKNTREKPVRSPSSKYTFRLFKDKMQTKVTSTTKNFIKNIKDKKLLTKAKEFAENFTLGSELHLQSGELQFSDTIPILELEPIKLETKCANMSNNVDTASDEIDSLYVSELAKITRKTKDILENVDYILNPNILEDHLLKWVTILNEIFYKLLVTRFHPQGQILESTEMVNSELKSENLSVINLPANERCETQMEEKYEVALSMLSNTQILECKCDCLDDLASNILNDKDFCYVSDPLQLDVEMLKNVSEFAQVCFDIGCHGNILRLQNQRLHNSPNADNRQKDDELLKNTEITPVENFVKTTHQHKEELCDTNCRSNNEMDFAAFGGIPGNIDQLSSGRLNGCKSNSELEHAYSDIDRLNGEHHTSSKFDGSLQDSRTKINKCDNIFHHDLSMAFFVRCYFPYLSMFAIQEHMLQKEVGYQTWSAVVTCMEAKSLSDGKKYGVDDKSVLDHLLETKFSTVNGTVFLGHIAKLFRQNNNKLIEVCERCYEHIKPLDVIYMCRYCTIPLDTLFPQYMKQLSGKGSVVGRDQILSYIQKNTDVGFLWLEMLLSEDFIQSSVMDDNNCPRCSSHKHVWKNSTMIDKLLVVLDPKLQHKTLELTKKYGYWVGVLKILKQTRQMRELMYLIIQLNDVTILTRTSDIGYLPDTPDEWNEFLYVYEDHRKTQTSNQPVELVVVDNIEGITWNNLAIVMVKSIGPEATINILENHNIPDGELSVELYQSCILAELVHKDQRLILHSLLEKVDSYLWSQRPTAFTPEVHYLAMMEKKLLSNTSANTSSDVLQALSGRLHDNCETLYTLEDPDCHWGVQTKINRSCPCCNIALKVSHEEPGVLLFQCGHAFHKICLPGKECLLCEDMQSQNLL